MNTARSLAVLLFLAGAVAGQAPPAPTAEGPQLSAARGNTGKRLGEIAAQLKTGQAAAAADDLRRLLADAGDDLVSDDGRLFRPARRAAHAVLAQLPPAELRAYRDRADAPALELLRKGERDKDPGPLAALVDQYFASTHAEAALSLLGDIAFERGDFRAAETYWRRLLPADALSPDPGVLNPTLDPARTKARVTLAVLFQGDSVASEAAFAAFKAAHPDAAGPLAGKAGKYVDALEPFRRSPPVIPAAASGDGDWPGFAGNPARTGHAAAPLAKYYPARPTWRVAVPGAPAGLAGFPGLPDLSGLMNPDAVPRGLSARQVGRHPVAVGGWGFVADAVSVFGFDLRTGAARFRHRHPDGDPAAPGVDADYPLTAAPSRGLLFARLGNPTVAPPPAAGPAVIVALAVPPVGAGGQLEVKFTLKPPAAAGVAAAWEAAPTWANGRLVAAFVREANNRLVTALACYADTGGDPLWVTDLVDAPITGGAGRVEPRARPEPVTVAAGLAVFTTHAGFVCGVDARTGKVVWAHTCPPAARPTPHARDLCPAIIDGGRVFAAPTDGDRVLCLDAVTGRLLWETTQVQIDQLLGIAAGRLVASVAAPVRGLRAYRVTSGSSREPDGWAVHDDPLLSSYGRGLVSEGAVVWPTRSAVFFARPTDGLPLGPRLLGPHGNLAFAGGVLLVATPGEVWGYVRGPLPPLLAPPPVPPTQRAADILAQTPTGGGPAARDAFRVANRLVPADDAAVVTRPTGAPARLGQLLAERFLPLPPPRPRVLTADLNPAPDPDPTPLGPGATVERSTSLPSRACLALRPFAGRAGLPGLGPDGGTDPLLVVADSGRLFAVRPADGKPAWECPLPAGLFVGHAHVDRDAVLAAGPRGVLAVGRADGKPRWHYPHPPDAPDLGDFHALADVVVARAGEHHLLALDAKTGDVLWTRDAQNRARLGPAFPSGAEVGPHVAAVAGELLAETGPNRRSLLDAGTGERVAGTDGFPNPWRGPPARLGFARVAVADGPGAVRALVAAGPAGGLKTAWVWAAPGEASLSGRLPLLRATPSGLVVAVDRNHATELDLLSLSHGERVWPAGPLLPAGECDLAGAAVTDRFLYVVVDDALHAVRLADGAAAWAKPADLPALLGCPPGGRYHVAAGPRGVAVAPADPVREDTFAPAALLPAALTGRMPVALLLQLDAWYDGRVPVVVLDPGTGNEVGRAAAPAAGPAPGVHLSGARPVVVAAGVAHWLR